jgi:hypothetical protein
MTMFSDPDNYTGGFDVAEVQHDLTGARDVLRAVETGRQLRTPVLDRRTDPATSLAWVVALLCIVIAVAACGLAVVTVQVARHWRGALELLLAAGIISYFLRGTR